MELSLKEYKALEITNKQLKDQVSNVIVVEITIKQLKDLVSDV